MHTTPIPTPPSVRTTLLLAAASAGLLTHSAAAASIYDDTTFDLSSTTASTPLDVSVFDGINGRLSSGDQRDDVTILGLLAGSTLNITTAWSSAATDGDLLLQFLDSSSVPLPGVPTLAPTSITGTDTRSVLVPGNGQVRLVATMTGFEFGALTYSLSYPVTPVPEPASGVTAAAALAALIARRRRGSRQ